MPGSDIALTRMACISFSGPSKLTPYKSSFFQFFRAVLFKTISFIVLSHSTFLQKINKMKNDSGLKVNDQLVAYATRFLAVRLKKYVWSHHRALKAKV